MRHITAKFITAILLTLILLSLTPVSPVLNRAEARPSAAITYNDNFSSDSLTNYAVTGDATWERSTGSLRVGNGDDARVEVYTRLSFGNNLQVRGKIYVPPVAEIGPFDSTALALTDADGKIKYWVTIGYGQALQPENFLALLRNDLWSAYAPLDVEADQWYHIAVDIDGLLLRAKAWADGGPEPGRQLQYKLDRDWTASGGAGFRHYGRASRVDDLSILDRGHIDTPTLQDRLPRPILDERPEWVDLYWAAWRLAWDHIQYGTPENGFVPAYMDEAFDDNIFQWDTTFLSMFARYGADLFPGIASLDNFYRVQHPDGFISRMIRESNAKDVFTPDNPEAINPPLFAWAEWQYYELTGDASRFDRVLPHLTRYYQWIKAHRRQPDGLYWTNNLGSGMDNSPRDAAAWTDLSMQQALAAQSIAQIARVAGQRELADEYQREYADLRTLINARLWDERDGFYYDLDEAGFFQRTKTVAAFWALTAGLADDRQAAALQKHLANPQEFWRPHVFPTLSATDPRYDRQGGYWKGAVWAPMNYAIIKGLERYGYAAFARQAAANHIANMAAVYASTETIWENYVSEFPSPGVFTEYGQRMAYKDFVGWSGLGPITLLIEDVLGFHADAPSDTLSWRLRSAQRHGIENLRFGTHTVSLVATPDLGTQSVTVGITADSAFKLVVDTGAVTQQLEVPAGQSRYTLPMGTTESLPKTPVFQPETWSSGNLR